MDDNYKYILLSFNPHYKFIPVSLFVSFILIIISLFYFKTYDVYNTKGYLECNDTCHISLLVDINDINKATNIDHMKLNNKNIKHHNISVGEIKVDENNKTNYQIVNYEVDQLDNDLNTFQDVKLYSNYESIIKKIIDMLK